MKMNRIVKWLSLVMLFAFWSNAYAGNEKRIKGLKGSTEIQSSAEIILEDYLFQNMLDNPSGSADPYTDHYKQEYASVKVKLRDENNLQAYYGSNWDLTVSYVLELTKADNTVITFPAESLHIDYTMADAYKDLSLHLYDTEAYHKAKLTVVSANMTGMAMPASIRLDVELDIERVYFIDPQEVPEITIKDNSSGGSWYGFGGVDKTDLEIRWTHVAGAAYYDLEWLFVDFPDASGAAVPNSQLPIPNTAVTINDLDLDFKNATRLRLSDNKYVMNLNYPRGYVIYRVRAVGYKLYGEQLDVGDWTVVASNSDLSATNTAKFIAYKGNPEADKNWNYTASYAENGKRKESISYFDGSLRNKQNIARLNTDGNAIVTQMMLDREGRSSLDVLPAVVEGDGLGYRYGLNKNTNGDNYSWEDFDTDNYMLAPQAMSTSSSTGAAKFYSSQNNTSGTTHRDLIPDAEGFPFSRTLYSNDGLNRPVRQSGLGDKMKMGSDQNVEMMYVAPAGSEELDRLFGTEVGTKGYTKNITINENEQITVKYFNQKEQLIASGIMGSTGSDGNLKDLDTAVYPLMDADEEIQTDILDLHNELTDLTWESQRSFSPEISNTYHFSYTLDAAHFNTEICDDPLFAPSPEYPFDVSLYVKDELGAVVEITIVSGVIDGAAPTGIGVPVDAYHKENVHNAVLNFEVEMDLGKTYYVTKKLSIDPDVIETGLAAEFATHDLTCLETTDPAPVLLFGCEMECMEDQGFYPVYSEQGSLLYFKDDNGAVESLSDAMHYTCVTDCNQLTLNSDFNRCEQRKVQMITAMGFGGQYFDNSVEEDELTYDPDAWLNTSGLTPPFSTGGWSNFKLVLEAYIDNGNSLVNTPYDGLYPGFEWTSTSWEEVMLPMHPEYEIFSCDCTPLEEPFDLGSYVMKIERDQFGAFYNQFYNISNDTDALNKGAFNPFKTNGILSVTHDPFSTTPVVTNIDVSEIAASNFALNLGSLPLGYLEDKFLTQGVQIYDSYGAPYGLPMALNRPVDFIPRFIEYLSNVTNVNGQSVSVWKILATSYQMGGYSGFSNVLSNAEINADAVLHGLLGPEGALNPNNINGPISASARIDFFRSQYYFYRELLWYEYNRNCANDNVVGDPFYLDETANEPYQLMYMENEVFEIFLNGGTVPPANYEYEICSEMASQWAQNMVNSFHYSTEQTLVEFVNYQNLLDIGMGNLSTSQLADALAFEQAEQALILELTEEFKNKECGDYADPQQSASFFSTPYTSTEFNITLSAVTGNNALFAVSPAGGGASLQFQAMEYPMELIDPADAEISYSPEALADCACGEYEGTMLNNGVDINNDTAVTSFLIAQGYITDPDEYSSVWRDYCALNQPKVLDYLFVSKMPEAFFCVEYPELQGFMSNYNVAYNMYLTDYQYFLQYGTDVVEATLNYELDSLVVDGLETVDEELILTLTPPVYHYTLYYYDQAGSLVKTVPPAGVHSINAYEHVDTLRAQNSGDTLPPHQLVTNYRYNSLNQLTRQHTPDGGTTRFWYDELGRLILSQDAVQVLENSYSYIVYDHLGRSVEGGKVFAIEQALNPEEHLFTKPYVITVPNEGHQYRNLSPFTLWLHTNRLVERTIITYDKEMNTTVATYFPNGPYEPAGQKRTRGRVTSSIFHKGNATVTPPWAWSGSFGSVVDVYTELLAITDVANPVTSISSAFEDAFSDSGINSFATSFYESGTHYSYDIHGNVDRLVLEYSDGHSLAHVKKTLHYQYDLLSGNVTDVVYQQGASDQYAHHYYYDADNRLTEVETSPDLEIWDTQAKYFYYAHGPLARVEIGEHQVQANDYAYTLQGWIKSVNASNLIKADDPGQDGVVTVSNLHKGFAEDVFGFNLNYFAEDYKSIGNGLDHHLVEFDETALGSENRFANLYNGNIASMTTGIDGAGVQATFYTYDQLQRIKTMDVYRPSPTDLTSHVELTAAHHTNKYQSDYTYDPNGNLLALNRKDDLGVDMDKFTYEYLTDTSGDLTNRLSYVDDNSGYVGTNDFNSTIASQTFDYDDIGNLISDDTEEIEEIKWNNQGKVIEIIRESTSTKPDLEFEYDAIGNRVSKLVKGKDNAGNIDVPLEWQKTIYIRDAQGNVMATYRSVFEAYALETQDHHVYGNDRLGVDEAVQAYDFTLSTLRERILGLSYFEQKNHLNNVLITISDRKESSLSSGQANYLANVISYSDYYPFGMQMNGRQSTNSNYRYGFQGQEIDGEIKGEGNSVNFKYRMHDSRLGRFFAVDPLTAQYPHNSPYAFSENDVIRAIELEGLEKYICTRYYEQGKYVGTSVVYVLNSAGKTMKMNLKHDYGKGEKVTDEDVLIIEKRDGKSEVVGYAEKLSKVKGAEDGAKTPQEIWEEGKNLSKFRKHTQIDNKDKGINMLGELDGEGNTILKSSRVETGTKTVMVPQRAGNFSIGFNPTVPMSNRVNVDALRALRRFLSANSDNKISSNMGGNFWDQIRSSLINSGIDVDNRMSTTPTVAPSPNTVTGERYRNVPVQRTTPPKDTIVK